MTDLGGISPLLVTVDGAAAMLGLKSRESVYKLIRSGDLEQVTVGRRSSRIVVASIESYVDSLRTPAPVASLRRLPRVAS